MKIIDLSKEHHNTYFKCLEDWSEEMQESGDMKEKWFVKTEPKGLRVKLAKDSDGTIIGMVQYIPIEASHVEGQNLYFIFCLWVHAYKDGIGDHRGKGIGQSLLKAVEEDVLSLGADGICAWGIILPFWMRSKWYKKNGYRVADRDGMAELVWKPFNDNAVSPEWLKIRKKPRKDPDKVIITAFRNGWCPAQNISYERVKRIASEYPNVEFVDIDTSIEENLQEWGIVDSIYVGDKLITKGPPLKDDKIRKILEKSLQKLK